ncbi:hypothetical protein AS890_01175 [Rhizobium anhuiense bv. trifolii]|nr:hypothetical protein AS890_01175 [Rhizobium anhuiense bv. trifolii]
MSGAEAVHHIRSIATKDMQQPWPPVADGFQKIGSTVAILDVGAVHHVTDHQAERIDDDMALAALGLLACIIAPEVGAFGS